MGTLWLGGAEGLIARNCTQIAGADTGFPERGGGISQAPPPLDIVCVTSFALRKIEKHPRSWTFTSIPPLDIVRVTSSALRKIEKHPPFHHCCCPKKGPPLPKKLSCPKAGGGGGLQPPCPPPPHTPMVIGLFVSQNIGLGHWPQAPFV